MERIENTESHNGFLTLENKRNAATASWARSSLGLVAKVNYLHLKNKKYSDTQTHTSCSLWHEFICEHVLNNVCSSGWSDQNYAMEHESAINLSVRSLTSKPLSWDIFIGQKALDKTARKLLFTFKIFHRRRSTNCTNPFFLMRRMPFSVDLNVIITNALKWDCYFWSWSR